MTMPSAEMRRPLERLRDRVHDALDHLPLPLRRRGTHAAGERVLTRPVFSGPALDVEETDDQVIVRAELPGLRREDFTVEATANRLVIRGDKAEEREEHGRGFYWRERHAGAFVRSVALPCEVDPDHTEAQYRDGVLRVTLPKSERARAQHVRVKVLST